MLATARSDLQPHWCRSRNTNYSHRLRLSPTTCCCPSSQCKRWLCWMRRREHAETFQHSAMIAHLRWSTGVTRSGQTTLNTSLGLIKHACNWISRGYKVIILIIWRRLRSWENSLWIRHMSRLLTGVSMWRSRWLSRLKRLNSRRFWAICLPRLLKWKLTMIQKVKSKLRRRNPSQPKLKGVKRAVLPTLVANQVRRISSNVRSKHNAKGQSSTLYRCRTCVLCAKQSTLTALGSQSQNSSMLTCKAEKSAISSQATTPTLQSKRKMLLNCLQSDKFS